MLAAIVVGFAIILWYGYTSLQSMLFTAPEAPIIAPVEQVSTEEVQQAPEVKPWEELVNPIDVMQNCYYATKKAVEIVTPGCRKSTRLNSSHIATSRMPSSA